VAIALSTCSANNKTWTPSCAGWCNNHEQLDWIPKTRHRWIEIVLRLTSLGFNLKTKLKSKKINSKYGVHRMLTNIKGDLIEYSHINTMKGTQRVGIVVGQDLVIYYVPTLSIIVLE